MNEHLIVEGILVARDEGMHPCSFYICQTENLGCIRESEELGVIINSHFPVQFTPYSYDVYGKVRIIIERIHD